MNLKLMLIPFLLLYGTLSLLEADSLAATVCNGSDGTFGRDTIPIIHETTGIDGPGDSLNRDDLRRFESDYVEQVVLHVLHEKFRQTFTMREFILTQMINPTTKVKVITTRSAQIVIHPGKGSIQIFTATGQSHRRRFDKDRMTTITISLTDIPELNELGSRTARVVPKAQTRLEARMPVKPAWIAPDMFNPNLELLRGMFRGTLIGDRAHPQIVTDRRTMDKVPSSVQEDEFFRMNESLTASASDDLVEAYGGTRPMRLGVQAPGGIGKTYMTAKWSVSEAQYISPEGKARTYQAEAIIYMVDTIDTADRNIATYKKEMGLETHQIARLHSGKNKRGLPNASTDASDVIGDDTRAVFVVRNSANKNIEALIEFAKRRPTVIILDEADLLAGNSAEWQGIVDGFNSMPQDPANPYNVMIYASATLYGDGTNLITDPRHLGFREGHPRHGQGKVNGTWLTQDMVYHLQHGHQEDIVSIASHQLRMAMILGYAPPIRLMRTVSHTAPNGDPIRNGVRKVPVNDEKDAPEVRVREFHTEEVPPVLDHIESAEAPRTLDRGIIVVNGIDAANLLAEKLNELEAVRAEDRDGLVTREFRPYHSRNSTGTGADYIDWMLDADSSNENIHKYLIVDGMGVRGTDIPKLNLLLVFKPHAHTLNGHRRFQQIVYRLTRAGIMNTSTRLIDSTGLGQTLAGNLAEILQASASRSGGGVRRPPLDVVEIDTPVSVESTDDVIIDEVTNNFQDDRELLNSWLVEHLVQHFAQEHQLDLTKRRLGETLGLPLNNIFDSAAKLVMALNNGVFEPNDITEHQYEFLTNEAIDSFNIEEPNEINEILKAYYRLYHWYLSEQEESLGDDGILRTDLAEHLDLIVQNMSLLRPGAGRKITLQLKSRNGCQLGHTVDYLNEYFAAINASTGATGRKALSLSTPSTDDDSHFIEIKGPDDSTLSWIYGDLGLYVVRVLDSAGAPRTRRVELSVDLGSGDKISMVNSNQADASRTIDLVREKQMADRRLPIKVRFSRGNEVNFGSRRPQLVPVALFNRWLYASHVMLDHIVPDIDSRAIEIAEEESRANHRSSDSSKGDE